MALLHVVIGDKNIDEEGSVELEQMRARLVETQNEMDRVKETLHQREEDCDKLRQVSSSVYAPRGGGSGRTISLPSTFFVKVGLGKRQRFLSARLCRVSRIKCVPPCGSV